MSKMNRVLYPTIPAFRLTASFEEAFGTTERTVKEQYLPHEWIFYAVKEGNVAFMVGGTLYPLGVGDVIMVAPYTFHHVFPRDGTPFR